MSFRYIGSKARVADQIRDFIGPHSGGEFVDAFCGTGVIAATAADLGWPIRINDSLSSAVITASARLISRKDARFSRLGGYAEALQQLNAIPPKEGFIWKSYSPASARFCGIERKYFTEQNAAKIDAVRFQINAWREQRKITKSEEILLVADLFAASNRVANIAGTFGCFLSQFSKQALAGLELTPRELRQNKVLHRSSVGDVFDVRTEPNDLVYLDPPYTKRQYASYYHILETIAAADEPVVEGVSGLRPWKDKASDFCYKVRALRTLSTLVESIEATNILLSYSSDGHIAIAEIEAELARAGSIEVHPLGLISRYRPNRTALNGVPDVTEYLIRISKEKVQQRSILKSSVRTTR